MLPGAVLRGAAGCGLPGAVLPGAAPGLAGPGGVVAGGAGGGGGQDEGGGGLAGQQVEVGAGAQGVQGAGDPGGFEGLGQGGEVLVGGQRGGGGQVAAGQCGGAGGFGEHLHPGVLQRLFFPPPGGGGVGGQDRAAHQGPQLPAGQPGRFPDDQGLDRGGVLIIEPGEFLGDDLGAAFVDQPGGQRGAGARQPVQGQRQFHQPPRAAPGQRERDRDLIIDMVKRPPVPALAPAGLTAGRQPGGGSELQRRRPGGQPPRGLQHPGQLIIIQTVQAIALDAIGQDGQDRPGGHGIRCPVYRELLRAGRTGSGEEIRLLWPLVLIAGLTFLAVRPVGVVLTRQGLVLPVQSLVQIRGIGDGGGRVDGGGGVGGGG